MSKVGVIIELKNWYELRTSSAEHIWLEHVFVSDQPNVSGSPNS